MRHHVQQLQRLAIIAAIVAVLGGCADRRPSPLETGGVRLKYQVHAWDGPGDPPDRQEICRVIERRLDDPNLPRVLVRVFGEDGIEVLVGEERTFDENPNLETIKSRLARSGTLSFQILANHADHGEIIKQARESPERDVREGGRVVARWVEVARDANGIPKIAPSDEMISRPGREVGKPKAVAEGDDDDGDEIHEYLVIEDPPEQRVTGRYLTRLSKTTDENGRPAIGFTLDEAGGTRFQILTSRNRPRADGSTRRLGIILDGRLHSAPNLRAVISTQGQITGQFTEQETDDLVSVLQSGDLPELTLVAMELFEPPGAEKLLGVEKE